MDAIHYFINSGTLTLIIAITATFLSVFGVLYPLIKKIEARDRYTAIITDKRRKLFNEARAQDKQKAEDKQVSSRELFATMFKMERLSGAREARRKLIQAGYRHPRALLIYLISRLMLPTAFLAIAFLFLQNIDKPLAPALKLLILFGLAAFGYALPAILVKNTAQKRQEEIQITFPDSLDMMLICVQGGIGIESAISRIAERIVDHSPTLAEELGILSAELAMLNDRKQAYRAFAERAGSAAARTFVNAMIQAEQYGSSVSNAMRVIAEELRDMRMGLAEQKAASLPPKLTVPMILFFLPVLFVVILGPAVIQASRTFGQ